MQFRSGSIWYGDLSKRLWLDMLGCIADITGIEVIIWHPYRLLLWGSLKA
jgi:hypothetical protein